LPDRGRGKTFRQRYLHDVRRRLCSSVSTVLLLSIFATWMFVPLASAKPAVNDSFGYDYSTHVSQGTGFYEGYKDVMNSHSDYKVIFVEGTNVTVQSTGSWTYDDNEGLHQSGSNDLLFSFDSDTREYLGVSDDEGEGYVDPLIWFWIDPSDLVVGNEVWILDDYFTVTSTQKTIWHGGLPREVAVLSVAGNYLRDDEYGVFDAFYEDTYYFDRGTGYIVGKKYVEHDSNVWATFKFTADVSITSSSYDLPINWTQVAFVYGGVPATLAVIALLVLRARRGPSTIHVVTLEGKTDVKISRVRKFSDMESLTPGGSKYFSPFLPVFAKRALAENDPVLIARSGTALLGTAVLDRESDLGSIFAFDEVVAKAFRKRLRLRDFFVEVDGTNWDLSPAQRIGLFAVLELHDPRPFPYDSVRIRAMRRESLMEVIELAEQVYRGKAAKWVRSCFEGGDIGFVAVDSSRVIGFGFATIAGSDARLHTLTVAPEYRSSGLGTDIMAARLSVLSALGVRRVVVEIAHENIASMRIATRAGFTKVGETAYYSQNPTTPSEAFFQRRM